MLTVCIRPLSPSASGLAVHPSRAEKLLEWDRADVTTGVFTPRGVQEAGDRCSMPPLPTVSVVRETSSRYMEVRSP